VPRAPSYRVIEERRGSLKSTRAQNREVKKERKFSRESVKDYSGSYTTFRRGKGGSASATCKKESKITVKKRKVRWVSGGGSGLADQSEKQKKEED